MLGMPPIASYFGTDPNPYNQKALGKYFGALVNKVGFSVLAVAQGEKTPIDLRTKRQEEDDLASWEAYQDAAKKAGLEWNKAAAPSGLYTSTSNIARLRSYIKTAFAGRERDFERFMELDITLRARAMWQAQRDGAPVDEAEREEVESFISERRARYEELLAEAESRKGKLKKADQAEFNVLSALFNPVEGDAEREKLEHASLVQRLNQPPVNFAVNVGLSNLVVVDCDTEDEVNAFIDWARERSQEYTEKYLKPDAELFPGERPQDWRVGVTAPTVRSPGVYDAGKGQWRHKNGGHFYFQLPALAVPGLNGKGEPILTPVKREEFEVTPEAYMPSRVSGLLPGGQVSQYATGRNDGSRVTDTAYRDGVALHLYPFRYADGVRSLKIKHGGSQFSIFVYNHYVLIPPSQREGRNYVPQGASYDDMPLWLYNVIYSEVEARRQRALKRAQYEGVAGDLSGDLEQWYEHVSWHDILDPLDYRHTGMDSCGCPIWQRPGGSSYKSVTTHVPGCSQYKDSQDPPAHFWTDNPGDEVQSMMDKVGSTGTLTKLQLFAAVFYGGDTSRAVKDGVRKFVPYDSGEFTFTSNRPKGDDGKNGYSDWVRGYYAPDPNGEGIQMGVANMHTVFTPAFDYDQDTGGSEEDVIAAIDEQISAHNASKPVQPGVQSAVHPGVGEASVHGSTPAGSSSPSQPLSVQTPGTDNVQTPVHDNTDDDEFDEFDDDYFDDDGDGDGGDVTGNAPAPTGSGEPVYDEYGYERAPESATPTMIPEHIYRSSLYPPPGPAGQAGTHFSDPSGVDASAPAGSEAQTAVPQTQAVDVYSAQHSLNPEDQLALPFDIIGRARQTTETHAETVGELARRRKPVTFLMKQETMGWYQDRAVSMVAGPSNAGKSAVLIDQLCTMARHPKDDQMVGVTPRKQFHKWKGVPTQPRRVLYIAGEGVDGVINRVRAWESVNNLQDGELDDRFKIIDHPFNFNSEPEQWNKLAWEIVGGTEGAIDPEKRFGVVVFDTLNTMSTGLDENSNSEMGVVMGYLEQLCQQTHAAVIIVHHTGKGEESINEPRGASAIKGAVATTVLVQKREMETLPQSQREEFENKHIKPIRVSVIKQKDSPFPPPMDLTIVGHTVPPLYDEHGMVLNAVDEFGNDNATTAALVGDATGVLFYDEKGGLVSDTVAKEPDREIPASVRADMARALAMRIAEEGSGPKERRRNYMLTTAKLRAHLSDNKYLWNRSARGRVFTAHEVEAMYEQAERLLLDGGLARFEGSHLVPHLGAHNMKDAIIARGVMEQRLDDVVGSLEDESEDTDEATESNEEKGQTPSPGIPEMVLEPTNDYDPESEGGFTPAPPGTFADTGNPPADGGGAVRT